MTSIGEMSQTGTEQNAEDRPELQFQLEGSGVGPLQAPELPAFLSPRRITWGQDGVCDLEGPREPSSCLKGCHREGFPVDCVQLGAQPRTAQPVRLEGARYADLGSI